VLVTLLDEVINRSLGERAHTGGGDVIQATQSIELNRLTALNDINPALAGQLPKEFELLAGRPRSVGRCPL